MAKCVLRCEKIKIGDVPGVVNHNLRKYENEEKAEHINYSKTEKNRISFGSADVRKRMNEIIDTRKDNKKAIRKDATVMLEFIASASPEFFYKDLDKNKFDKLTMKENQEELQDIFSTLDENNLKEFERIVVEWFKNEFGKDNIVNITLHLDEKTPHFHCLIVPMTKDKRLSAKEVFNPVSARNWQTSFANFCEHLGLERGEKFSGAVHTSHYTYNTGLIQNNRLNPPEKTCTSISSDEFKLLNDKQKINYLLTERKDLLNRHKFYKAFYDCYKDEVSELNLLREENNKLIEENSLLKRNRELGRSLSQTLSVRNSNGFRPKI